MTIATGTRFGPYEIVAPLASGGMGEIYRAADPRLGREVAIKVLPEELALDPERLRRFGVEARAASALNHPNVLTVFDADVEGGVAYLVTELLHGETLRERLGRGVLPLRLAVRVAIGVAEGLSAVHAAGIVHRDIKPENIFLTRDDRVKILDFGLVRPVSASARAGSLMTDPGLVVGTPGYMSPEQVEGGEIDHRSDLFSLGCVLYEMVTGKRPFDRLSVVETMSAALREDPPEPLLPDGRPLPAAFGSILARCLEKRPARRYQSASDLAFHLQTLESGAQRSTIATAGLPRKSRRWHLAGWASALLAVAFASVLLTLWLAGPTRSSPPKLTYLTFSGHDTAPDASPDGSLVVFTSLREGVPRVWIHQTATASEASLTEGPDRFPRVSPDGSSVLFTRSSSGSPGQQESHSALYKVSILGGEPRKVVERAEAGDWAPDGQRVVFTRVSQGKSGLEWGLFILDLAGGEERPLAPASPSPLVTPRWSPDGKSIAVVRSGRLALLADEILLVDVESGAAKALKRAGEGVISAPAWSPKGQEISYTQSSTVTAYVPQSRLVEQSVHSGEVRTLAWIPTQVTTVDFLKPGTLVLDGLSLRQSLREIPLETGASARWLSRGGAVDRQPVYSRDGAWVIFSSSRSGNLDLWALSLTGGSVRRLTEDPGDDWDPWTSPDGKNIYWSSNRSGHFEVFSADLDGHGARQLSSDELDAQNPSVDKAGKWLVWVCGRDERLGLWRKSLETGDEKRLVAGINTMSPEISPDGEYVQFHTPPDPGWSEIRVVKLTDGSEVPAPIRIEVPAIPVSLSTRPRTIGRARFTPDGKGIAFVGLDDRGQAKLFVQDFVPGRDTRPSRRPLVSLADDETAESFAISPDGKRVTVSLIEQSPNLLLVDLSRSLSSPPGKSEAARP